MEKDIRIKRLTAVCGVAAVFSLGAAAQSANTTVTRTPGNYSRETVVTAMDGRTAEYERNASWGNGSFNGSRSVTGFNGRTASSSTSGSYAPGNFSRQTITTRFDGRTTQYRNDATWGHGAYTASRSFTDVNGGTRTAAITRCGGAVTKTVTGRNGNARTRTRFIR